MGEDWSGRRGSNPRPTAWKAVTLPLSYSRLRIHRTPRRNEFAFVSRSLTSVRFALNASVADLPALNPTKPPRSRRLTSTTSTVVARGGFEPPKPLGRQIYSLLRLTAPQPRRIPHTPLQSFNSRHTNPNTLAGTQPDCRRTWHQLLFGTTRVLSGWHRFHANPSPLRWSWRRDSNPRPADYKSAALPD